MSDSEDASVLGKRPRNGESREDEPAENPQQDVGDESDDDVGPMPMPEGPGESVTKKKRKGIRATDFVISRDVLIEPIHAVLPHEKLYLEHLPSADRYYKSFMHRDAIHFVTMTR